MGQLKLTTKSSGMTVIEVLIVITIVGILSVSVFAISGSPLLRSQDARRKTDLKKIANALEQYYDDHSGYPAKLADPDANGAECGTATLITAYLANVPCDIDSMQPYLYIPIGTQRTNKRGETVYPGYRLLAALKYTQDPQIAEQGCAMGCKGKKRDGFTPVPVIYNWGVTANAKLQL